MKTANQSAAVVLIGDELLSGRTGDKNLSYIAHGLSNKGIVLNEVRIIPDDQDKIVKTIRQLKQGPVDYVVTTGGIGGTHDDITTQAIALATNKPLELNEEALAYLQTYYKGRHLEMTVARHKMALIPHGAKLIPNSLTAAPGFYLENIFVLAGVPQIMQVMFNEVLQRLPAGPKKQVITLDTNLPEGLMTPFIENLLQKTQGLTVGSYPRMFDKVYKTSLVFGSYDIASLEKAVECMRREILNLKGTIFDISVD